MIINPTLERKSFERESLVLKRRRRVERHAATRSKRKNTLLLIVSLGLIIITSFCITYNMYISRNSKDLGFAVEHYFTTGFSSTDRLLRVQKMSLIYCDGENAIVEASGLSKNAPHKSTTVKGSFKKDDNKSWYLEKFLHDQ